MPEGKLGVFVSFLNGIVEEVVLRSLSRSREEDHSD